MNEYYNRRHNDQFKNQLTKLSFKPLNYIGLVTILYFFYDIDFVINQKKKVKI